MANKVFVDTNIILDIFLKREPFFDDSQKVVLEIVENNFIPHISGSSVTDWTQIQTPQEFLVSTSKE